MQKFFVDENQINLNENKIYIIGDDVNHIKNVLRYEVGENIEICSKSDIPLNYICEIYKIDSKEILCNILRKTEVKNESNVKIHIFQGLPKAEKMELIIQKCSELGVYEFIPVAMDRSIVKLKGKDEEKKIERWKKISEVASKQCGRNIVPNVRNIITLKDFTEEIKKYDKIIVAYENEKNNFLKNEIKNISDEYKNLAIVIGPEGGFEESEIKLLKEKGASIVSLGNRILRTETVAMVISGIIMYEIGDIGGIK